MSIFIDHAAKKHKLQKLKDVDPANIGDLKLLIYKTASGKHEYESTAPPGPHTLHDHTEYKLDTLDEKTSDVGVTIDGLTIKDSKINEDLSVVGYVIIEDGAGRYLQLPSLTTTQRDALSPVNGMLIYNSTTNKVNAYENGAWVTLLYSDADAIAAVEGEATLDLTGDVTIAAGKSLSVDTIGEKTGAAGVTIDGVLLKDYNITITNAYQINFGTAGAFIKGTVGPTLLIEAAGGVIEFVATSIDFYTSLLPAEIMAYNLGSPSFEWEHLYLSGKIYLGAAQEANLYQSGGNLKTDDIFESAGLKADTLDELTGAAGVTIDGVLIKDGLVDGVDVSVQDALKIKGVTVDDAAIGDDKILVYKTATSTLVYEAKPTGGFNQGFRAVQTAQQTIPTATFTKINFHSEDYDLANEFSLVNDQFVPSANGYYLICGHCTLINLADGKKIIVSIYKNGARFSEGRTTVGGTDYVGVFVSDVLYLLATDTIELRVYHNHGANLNTTGSGVGVAFSAWRLV